MSGRAGVVALEVVDRHPQTWCRPARSEVSTESVDSTRSVGGRAQELEAAVLLQRAGQQAGLGEDLEAVADADDRAAVRRELRHRAHHRGEPGDGAGAEVVAMGEAAGDDDRVERRRRCRRRARGRRRRRRASRIASMTSCSQFEPGKRTTPTRRAIRPTPPR